MSISLLDVNVLIALAWPTHVHNQKARSWFAANRSNGWATCPITQCAFVRISSNPKILPESVEAVEAVALLNKITALDDHVFWNDEVPFLAPVVPTEMLVSHRQIIDAYLLGLAVHFGGKLVTFDRGTDALLPPDSPHRSALDILRPS